MMRGKSCELQHTAEPCRSGIQCDGQCMAIYAICLAASK